MWQSWFQIHPETVFDHTTQKVTSLARTPDHVDLFMIGFDNAIWTTWWEQSVNWQPWKQIHPETVFDHTVQRVTAVARNSTHVDLFVTGFDNVIWTTSWQQGQDWQPWKQIDPVRTFDHATQSVTALSRTPGHVDLFVVGNEQSIWTTWSELGTAWQPWQTIHPEVKFDPGHQKVAAVARTQGHVDLFVIGFDGVIYTSWWEQGPGWQAWKQIRPEKTFDTTTQRVAALARTQGHVDLFVIGNDNVIWSTWWEQNADWQPWISIHPETVFDHTRQRVIPLARTQDHVDLFAIGFDNAVWTSWWEQAANWQPWQQIHPETIFDHTAQEATALARGSDHVDLFVTGFDNAVWSTWWGPDPPGMAQVSADGSTVTFDSGALTSSLALGGSVHVVMDRNGSFTFSCSAHDSGFDNIDYTVAAVVLDPNGIAFTFSHSGHVEGTSAGLPLGSPNRDDSFTTGGVNQQITSEWSQIPGARMSASINGTDKLKGGIEGMIGDLLSQLLQQAEKAAVTAVVGLVS